jgi:hypothetical protein
VENLPASWGGTKADAEATRAKKAKTVFIMVTVVVL